MDDHEFYTLKGYDLRSTQTLSPAMEDYLEMICRYANQNEFIRVSFLALKLNVTPPSASKMVNKLKEQGYLQFQPYGIMKLTKKGWEMGAYLLHRHEVLNEFFRIVNKSKMELELVEKIEHYIDAKTLANMEAMLPKLKTYRKK